MMMSYHPGAVVVAPPNVAFSCWRGLASLVKARQRLYQRKMQGRASPLQRDVRRRFLGPLVMLPERAAKFLIVPFHLELRNGYHGKRADLEVGADEFSARNDEPSYTPRDVRV